MLRNFLIKLVIEILKSKRRIHVKRSRRHWGVCVLRIEHIKKALVYENCINQILVEEAERQFKNARNGNNRTIKKSSRKS